MKNKFNNILNQKLIMKNKFNKIEQKIKIEVEKNLQDFLID